MVAQLGPLDPYLRLDLRGVARRRPANYLLKAVGRFEFHQPAIPLCLPGGDQIVMTAAFDPLQIFGVGHAAVDHHRAPGAFAGAPLERPKHLIQRGGVVAIAGENFVCFGEAVAVEDQAHHYLLAVGALVARVAALGLRIALGPTLEVGRGEIIKQQGVVEIKQGPFARGQCRFDLLAPGMELVEIAVKGGFAQDTEVALQQLLQRTAPDPVGHRMFRARRDQAIEHHCLGQYAGALSESGARQDLRQP